MTRTLSVLIVGGNSFMGLETVRALANDGGPQVFVLNRSGKIDWAGEEFPRNVVVLRGDRKHADQAIAKWLSKSRSHVFPSSVALVDFCGYSSRDVRALHRAVAEATRIALYVFVSTDSVYNVSTGRERNFGKWKEEDLRLPEDPKEQKAAKRADRYGFNKAKAEIALSKLHVPWVALRLCDVVGAYDRTHRLFAYYLWALQGKSNPVHRLADPYLRLGITFSLDVVRAISACIDLFGGQRAGKAAGFAVNIATDEQPTLEELVRGMVPRAVFTTPRLGEREAFLPSVECGPIDNTRMREWLGCAPTPLGEALACCEAFFRSLGKHKSRYTKEIHAAEEKIPGHQKDRGNSSSSGSSSSSSSSSSSTSSS